MVWMLMAMAALAYGQQPAQQTPPASQPAQTQPGSQPAAGQQGAAQTGAAPAAAPQGKRPLQAKTQPEFDAYKAAIANTSDAAAMEKAADDFATKFPDSELRAPLYQMAMRVYQNANNAEKMTEMGRKVLKIDPDDPESLVDVALVLSQRTRDTDLDKDQRLDEATKMAQHALQTIDTDIAPPAGTPAEKIEAYKSFLRSTAYSVIGAVALKRNQFADAEAAFRKSVDAYPASPDPVTILQLALSLDKQNKYPDALKEANHAVELTQEATPLGKMVRQERDRLVALTGGKPAETVTPK
jgi:tetratricopeptide (TPR) repeat protein